MTSKLYRQVSLSPVTDLYLAARRRVMPAPRLQLEVLVLVAQHPIAAHRALALQSEDPVQLHRARRRSVARVWRAESGEDDGIKKWFADYPEWMTTSKNGMDERNAKNNHGIFWVMQVEEFARLAGNRDLTDYCRTRFKTVLLPNQTASDGSFPLELRRTKL
ncbi:MAG: alginate lyase family protein [Terriglobia bacterium]